MGWRAVVTAYGPLRRDPRGWPCGFPRYSFGRWPSLNHPRMCGVAGVADRGIRQGRADMRERLYRRKN